MIENAQYDPHCLRLFSGVIAPFVIQSPASTRCGRHALEFPIASASPHIVRLVTRILGHSITVRPISKFGPSQTEKKRFWALVVWIGSTGPLKLLTRVLSSVIIGALCCTKTRHAAQCTPPFTDRKAGFQFGNSGHQRCPGTRECCDHCAGNLSLPLECCPPQDVGPVAERNRGSHPANAPNGGFCPVTGRVQVNHGSWPPGMNKAA